MRLEDIKAVGGNEEWLKGFIQRVTDESSKSRAKWRVSDAVVWVLMCIVYADMVHFAMVSDTSKDEFGTIHKPAPSPGHLVAAASSALQLLSSMHVTIRQFKHMCVVLKDAIELAPSKKDAAISCLQKMRILANNGSQIRHCLIRRIIREYS